LVEAIKMPSAASSDPNIHPVTLRPFTDEDLVKHGYEKLRTEIVAAAATVPTSATTAPTAAAAAAAGRPPTAAEMEEIQRLKNETATILRQKLDDRAARVRDIDREMAEKQKIREVERKVFYKKFGSVGSVGSVGGAAAGGGGKEV
jgi:hypothetical protein